MSDSKAVISSPDIFEADQLDFEADQLDRAEYQALETALLQSARGRNFLTEYLRRNGGDAIGARTLMVEEGLVEPRLASDTDKILQAVEKLHNAVMHQQAKPADDHARMDILEMAKAIARTRAEITAMRADGENDHLSVASGEMDAIVVATEKATNDILLAAEKIQEVAWRLREAGTEEAACEEIDNSATDIYMACSFQDLTGQRTTKVIRVLQYLEARINSMIDIWGLADDQDLAEARGGSAAGAASVAQGVEQRPDAHLLNGPQQAEAALGQDNIDALLGDDAFAMAGNDDQPVVDPDNEPSLAQNAEDVSAPASSGDLIDEEQLKALFS